VLRAYKYRIYPDKEQAQKLEQFFGATRFIYNWGLEQKTKQYQQDKKNISFFKLTQELTKLKQQKEFEWLNDVYSQSLQASLRNLDNAFVNFFRKNADFPKFKSKRKSRASCQFPQGVKLNFEQYQVFIPKLKYIKFAKDRKFDGIIKTCTVSKSKTNKYYISILVEDGLELPKKQKINENNTLGIDLGIKDFLVLSNGTKIPNPKFLEKAEKKIAKRNRELSRKQKGSQNREKARLKLAKTYEKITNKRDDFLHKLSHKLVTESQITTLCFEDLNISGMMKNRCLAKFISSASWSRFISMVKYKANWYGKNVIQINRFDASSKICSCGVKNDSLTLKDRFWTCLSCGNTHDRDVLAANNIKKFALMQTLGGKDSLPSINKACGAINNSWSNEAGTARLRRVSCQRSCAIEAGTDWDKIELVIQPETEMSYRDNL
jgi:putative transposase